jgi:ATP-dependent RNA helicase RhlE
MHCMKFADLRLVEPLLRAVAAEGYTVATPIQIKAIPPVLEGRDLMGCAQTGTGKTAAFALPILQRLNASPRPGAKRIRCLVLCPTRELASQIADSFTAYGRNLSLRNTVIFGGVNQNPQVRALRQGVDVLVATPGRLLDLMNQGFIDLRGIEILVLDEADRMLDMGFIRDIRKIIAKLPTARQTLLFSATIPAEIQDLAHSLLHNPVSVRVTPVATAADHIEESVYFVEKRNKPQLLAHLVEALPMIRAIVFTRTKHGADKVARHLNKCGIRADAIHGNKSQNNRERALENFRCEKTPVLVATDIASRGIDVDGITHVVNYDLSHEPETYIHRIGRTARAGASGSAVAFCDREEVPSLRAIERLLRRPIPVAKDQPEYADAPPAFDPKPQPSRRPSPSAPARHDAPRPSRHATPDRAARQSAHQARRPAAQSTGDHPASPPPAPARGPSQYTGRVPSRRRRGGR